MDAMSLQLLQVQAKHYVTLTLTKTTSATKEGEASEYEQVNENDHTQRTGL